MLAIALAAVCFGLIRMEPGLGILLVIFVTPAFLRTAVVASRRRAADQPMNTREKIEAFIGSLGLVMVLGIAAGFAFLVTCFASFFIGASAGGSGEAGMGVGLMVGLIGGSIAAIFVVVLLLRRWPWKRTDG
jgi:hypothetical protein